MTAFTKFLSPFEFMVAVITTELLHNVAVSQTELSLGRVGYRAGAVGTGSIEGALELPQAILPTEVHALPVQEGFRGFDVHQLAHGAGFELILADLLRVAGRCRFFGGFCTVGLGGGGLGSSEVLGGIGTEFLETDIITQVLHITITYNVVFTFTNLKKKENVFNHPLLELPSMVSFIGVSSLFTYLVTHNTGLHFARCFRGSGGRGRFLRFWF